MSAWRDPENNANRYEIRSRGGKGTMECDSQQSPVAAGCFVEQPVERFARIDPQQASECACMCVYGQASS
jgi:hypothetical protein